MGPQGFTHAKQTFYQLSHIPSSWPRLYSPFKSLFSCPPPKGSPHRKQWASAASSSCKHFKGLQVFTALRSDIQCLPQLCAMKAHCEVGTEMMLSQNTALLFSDSLLYC